MLLLLKNLITAKHVVNLSQARCLTQEPSKVPHLGDKPAMSSSQSINQQEAIGFLPPERQTIPDNMSPDKAS